MIKLITFGMLFTLGLSQITCTGTPPTNCKLCDISYQKICVECKDGFLIQGKGTYRANCNTSCDDKCKTCQTTASTCKSCVDGYYNSGGSGNVTCTQCVPNCKTCTSTTNCQECKDGYIFQCSFQKPICSFLSIQCVPNCKTCTSTTNCQECQDGYFNQGDTQSPKCIQCVPNCKTCTSTTNCKKCKDGYNFAGTIQKPTCSPQSIQCVPNCKTCTSKTNCQKCKDGYFNQGDTQSPNCTQCVPNCKTCTSTTNCKECKDGYFNLGGDTQSPTCTIQCIPNCKTCTSTTNCEKCQDGYSFQCYFKKPICSFQCIPNCKTCTSTTNCQECQDGYFNQGGDTQSPTCTIQCIPNCKTCTSTTNCQKCKDGYFNQGDTQSPECTQCVPNCKTCTSTTNCQECKDGYFNFGTFFSSCNSCDASDNRIIENQNCICQDGYYDDTINIQCQACMYNCKTCSNNSSCTSCDAFDNRLLENYNCICLDGYYDDTINSYCKECIYNCKPFKIQLRINKQLEFITFTILNYQIINKNICAIEYLMKQTVEIIYDIDLKIFRISFQKYSKKKIQLYLCNSPKYILHFIVPKYLKIDQNFKQFSKIISNVNNHINKNKQIILSFLNIFLFQFIINNNIAIYTQTYKNLPILLNTLFKTLINNTIIPYVDDGIKQKFAQSIGLNISLLNVTNQVIANNNFLVAIVQPLLSSFFSIAIIFLVFVISKLLFRLLNHKSKMQFLLSKLEQKISIIFVEILNVLWMISFQIFYIYFSQLFLPYDKSMLILTQKIISNGIFFFFFFLLFAMTFFQKTKIHLFSTQYFMNENKFITKNNKYFYKCKLNCFLIILFLNISSFIQPLLFAIFQQNMLVLIILMFLTLLNIIFILGILNQFYLCKLIFVFDIAKQIFRFLFYFALYFHMRNVSLITQKGSIILFLLIQMIILLLICIEIIYNMCNNERKKLEIQCQKIEHKKQELINMVIINFSNKNKRRLKKQLKFKIDIKNDIQCEYIH